MIESASVSSFSTATTPCVWLMANTQAVYNVFYSIEYSTLYCDLFEKNPRRLARRIGLISWRMARDRYLRYNI